MNKQYKYRGEMEDPGIYGRQYKYETLIIDCKYMCWRELP